MTVTLKFEELFRQAYKVAPSRYRLSVCSICDNCFIFLFIPGTYSQASFIRNKMLNLNIWLYDCIKTHQALTFWFKQSIVRSSILLNDDF